MAEPLIIQLIADYGTGDPAFAEVVQRLTYLDGHIRVRPTSVPPFSTIATGLWISQFATVNAFSGLVIYSNTAPRMKHTEEGGKILGGQFAVTTLDSGVIICAVNIGCCFSFIKSQMMSLHAVNVSNHGSQFRSRDFYPDAVMGIAHGEKQWIGEEIPLSSVPEPPSDTIGFIDGYGNLKTTMRCSINTISISTNVEIEVNGIKKEGVVADETYFVADGDICFAPGSTGGEDRFMEIWVRGGSAWEAFNRPKVESTFYVCPKST